METDFEFMERAGVSNRLIDADWEQHGLYGALHRAMEANKKIANEWIASYKTDKNTSFLELLQCFITTAGCPSQITRHLIETIPYEDLLKKLTTESQFLDESQCALYPPRLKPGKFGSNFHEFLDLLFRSEQYFVLLDIPLLKRLVYFVKALCGSAKRNFRLTGTLIGVKLTSAVIDASTRIAADSTYEEQGERPGDGLTDEELKKMANVFHKKLEHLFKSLFKTGLWDENYVWPEVRSFCINEFGLWILKFPQIFFDLEKLHFIGRLLSDIDTSVQINCIEILQPLFNSEEFYADEFQKLEQFTMEFKHLIIKMACEMNNGSVPAITLLTSIAKNIGPLNVFTDDECKQVYQLIYAPNRPISKAAGSFCITSWTANNLGGNAAIIRGLIKFLLESEHPGRVDVTVDILINLNPMMKDWNRMTDLLLYRQAIHFGEAPLDDNELNMLIKLMITCIRKAATGKIPGRHVMEIGEQQMMTEHFIPLMEQLLDKFASDSEKMANLLIIPRYFKVSSQITTQMKMGLEGLLKNVASIFAVHTDKKVLEGCAQIFNIFGEIRAISEKAKASKNMMMDMLTDEYLASATSYRRDMRGVRADSDSVRNLVLCLEKLNCFYSCNYFDYGDRDLFDSVFCFVVLGREGDDMPENIAQLSLTTCLHIILREFDELDRADTSSTEKIDSLKLKLKKFLDEFQLTISCGRPSLQVKAFTIACDLLVKFGINIKNRRHLSSLIYTPTDEYKTELVRFLDKYVFDSDSMFDLAVRQRCLAKFCKLVDHKLFGGQFAAAIFKNLHLFSQDFDDIIGNTLKTALTKNLEDTVETLLTCLWDLFTQTKSLPGGADEKSLKFEDIKELAKKLASFLGSGYYEVYDAVHALHRRGIRFAVDPSKNPEDPAGPPPNVGFLAILSEFSQKLFERNKVNVLKYLEKNFQKPKTCDERKWEAYELYRRSLDF